MAHTSSRSLAIIILSACSATFVSGSLQAQPSERWHNPRMEQGEGHFERQDSGRQGQRGRDAPEHYRGGPGSHPGPWHSPGARPHNGNGPMPGPAMLAGPPAHARQPMHSHGPGPQAHFHRGGVLPAPYIGPGYYVAQPHFHGLPAPHYGQRWVRVGADYLLVAIATGLIIDMVQHRR